MAQKKESFFWTSYSDLMTSLFFVMLVLFILVIVLLHKRMEATEDQLKEIKKVEQSTKDLSQEYFQYRLNSIGKSMTKRQQSAAQKKKCAVYQ